jgi:hypothetical protein
MIPFVPPSSSPSTRGRGRSWVILVLTKMTKPNHTRSPSHRKRLIRRRWWKMKQTTPARPSTTEFYDLVFVSVLMKQKLRPRTNKHFLIRKRAVLSTA